jgi:hypothetical protein
MRTLIYLCYGSGIHVSEAIFSLLSALRFGAFRESGFQCVVYTDDPKPFFGLGAEIVELEAPTLAAWIGKDGYVHRRKTMTIIDALNRFPGSVVFVDCDTYFLKPPAMLFDRVGPGQSRLHIREARLLESRVDIDRVISDAVSQSRFHDLSGLPLDISPDAAMWNSGVLGLHSSDARLMDETLNLIDQMWVTVKDAPSVPHHVEQFASGYFLGRTRVSESHRLVYHYWPEYMRNTFRRKLPDLLAATASLPLHERSRSLFAARPRANAYRKILVGTRTALRSIGLRAPGMRTNA